MTAIPDNLITTAELEAWYTAQQELTKLRAKEILLRKAIFSKAFPSPKEGTNNYQLPDGYVLKGTYGLVRTVDEAVLDAQLKAMRKAAINTDKLFTYKASLSKSEYNMLTAEQQHLADQCLIIKPGSPSLKIEKPKKASKPKGV